MSDPKRVAVIGAGLVGLGAIRNFLEVGYEPTCFELTGYVGGLWRYHEDDVEGIASVMRTTIINTSKEMGAFSDFPPPAEYPNYMHNSMMYEYIKSAYERTEATKYIRFHHEVKTVVKAEDYEKSGRWVVTARNTQTGDQVTETYDCVAVCIGHHVHPNVPTFPGQEQFQGQVMHTHSLKKAQGFEDLSIVVVGVGNSGMDAACELSSVAKKVYLSSRRGTWVLPKVGPMGLPFDALMLRRYTNLAMRHLPYSWVCNISERFVNSLLNHRLYNLKPKHRIWSQHPTASDTLPIKLLSGVVVTRNNIKTFTKNGVIFEGEEEETPVDAAVLATGYRVKFTFLSDKVMPVKDNRVPLYKFMLPPHLTHPTLFILGQIQPNGPGIPPGELQCRWASRVVTGQVKLPPKEKMYEDIRRQDEHNRQRFTDSPRHTFQVDFIGYQDELAEQLGVKPNLLKLAITDPKLFYAIFVGPSLPYQYRLQGPGAWSGARDAILTYDDRVKAPFLRPGEKMTKREARLLTVPRVLTFLLFLPVLWYLFQAIMSA